MAANQLTGDEWVKGSSMSSYCINDGASQIARLTAEVEGLSAGLKFAVLVGGEDKASQYARVLKSKLEIARDELECAIEDQRIFRDGRPRHIESHDPDPPVISPAQTEALNCSRATKY